MNIQLIRYHDIRNINTRLAKSLDIRQGVLPPLGISYLASALEKSGHNVQIIDAKAEALSAEDVRCRIKNFKPDLVGITSMTPSFHGAQEAAVIAKEEGAITVIGGVHMDIFAKETLSYDYIDYGILGEGEESIVELCRAIENRVSVEDVEGIAYKRNGEIMLGNPRIIGNLDSLEFPAYNLLPMKRYNSIIGLSPVTTMMSSRGCPYKCSFCCKTSSDKKHRYRSAKNVIDEMEFLVKDYAIKEIMFYDDLMMPSHVEEICREIIKRKLKVSWETPQRVDLVNPGILSLMKKAGCRLLRYGVEQGDPAMMQMIEKHITIEQVKKVFKWTEDAGIDTFAYFIIGYAFETEKTIRATIDLAKEINPRFVMFTKAIPLPNTELHRIAIEEGLINEDYWKEFTLGKQHIPLSAFVTDVNDWIVRAYREFYLRPSKALKQILRIRNVDDLKKNLSGFMGIFSLKKCDSEMSILYENNALV